jgi:hypothetical protein
LSSNNASKTPPKCNQAITRLERAILRLERASLAVGGSADERLKAEIAEMRSLTQSVSQRLDGAISRIRVALEN